MRQLQEEPSGTTWSMSISNCNYDSLVAKIQMNGNEVLLLVDTKSTDLSLASTDNSNANVSLREMLTSQARRYLTFFITLIELFSAAVNNRLYFRH